LRILCLGTALFAPQGLINLYFVNHRGRPAFPMGIGLLSIAISVVGGLLLIPVYGTTGAAWATTLSYGLASAVSVSFFLRRSGLPFSELWRARRADLSAYVELARQIAAKALAVARALAEKVFGIKRGEQRGDRPAP
jgi:Na+-driven multidrug efflux pump